MLKHTKNQSNLTTPLHFSQFSTIFSHLYFCDFFLTPVLASFMVPVQFFLHEGARVIFSPQSPIFEIQVQTCPVPAEHTVMVSPCS